MLVIVFIIVRVFPVQCIILLHLILICRFFTVAASPARKHVENDTTTVLQYTSLKPC
ncbi:hypothetical protein BGY98DRAFT_1071961 [Russula aff. rugulosa BPL654]|nr:hypothetical protein BGY98DRAFT_1071961 [Russula aff. rugulosa BPL654]